LLKLLKTKRNTEGNQRKKSHNIYQDKGKIAKDCERSCKIDDNGVTSLNAGRKKTVTDQECLWAHQ